MVIVISLCVSISFSDRYSSTFLGRILTSEWSLSLPAPSLSYSVLSQFIGNLYATAICE